MVLKRLVFCVVHCAAHVLFYVVPRALMFVLVKGPLTLIEAQIGEQRTFPDTEFVMQVITNWWDKSTLRRFGIVEQGMLYPSPLYNGHLQTILGAHRLVAGVKYRRVTVLADDTCPICLDWSLATTSAEGIQGVLLLVPGLASSSQSSYIRQFVLYANASGFHCCVLNTRGMGDTPITTPRLMSAVFTADVRKVLRNNLVLTSAADAAILAHSSYPMQAVGFSMGGLILTNYLYEESIAGRTSATDGMGCLKAAYTLCSPWDMHESSNHMLRPTQLVLYQPTLSNGLKEYIARHRNIVEKLPEIDPNALSENGLLTRLRTVQEFDAAFAAPHYGFSSKEEYYTAASVVEGKLEEIALPMLNIGATDDPIVGHPPHDRRWEGIAQRNKHIVFVRMPVGGHLGFVGNPWEELRGVPEASHTLLIHAAKSILSSS